MLETIVKLGPILALFTADQPRWTAGSVAQQLGTPRSTTSALMNSLVELGLLE